MDPLIVRGMGWATKLLAGAVLLIVASVLFGYAQGQAALISVQSGWQGMSILTAPCLAALAVGVVLDGALKGVPTRLISCLVVVFGLLVLALHISAGDDLASPFVALALFGTDAASAGHASVATALGLMLLAGAQLRRLDGSVRHSDTLAGGALLLAGTALLGYAYNVRDLYSLHWFNGMAVNTAAALFMLGLATICAHVGTGIGIAATIASAREGGAATRRLLGFTVLPPLAGWLLLHATSQHLVGEGTALALLVVLTIAPLLGLGLRQGRILDALDDERQAKLHFQQQQAGLLERLLGKQALQLAHESAERAKAEVVLQRAQRMEAVGQLTGGIAHDFNNLLMAISGNIQLLQHTLPAEHASRRFADKAATAVAKGAKLTGQLLAFSRTQHLNIRPMALDPILTAARELVGNALGPRIDVELDLQSGGAWVLTDDDQLQFAILNLALNARDAMPEGGHFRIAARQCHREQADGAAKPYVTLSVSDTGSGMAPEVAARAGEPFFTTKEHGKGSGLGLAQVYGVTHQCGGELRIASQPGLGTTIEILLPCVAALAAPVPAHAAAPAAPVAAPAGKPLLLIDDDQDVREVFAQLLRNVGYTVIEAADGAGGLRAMDQVEPALAIIDFLMPGMNGAEVARQALQRQPDLPVIFISGYADTLALDGIPGAVVLRKPIQAETLLATVAGVLEKTV